MTTHSISRGLKDGRLYSHALLSAMLILVPSINPKPCEKTKERKGHTIDWNVDEHKVKSSAVLSIALTQTMGTGKTRLLMGCFSSGTVSLYEQGSKGLKEVRKLGEAEGGITDIKLLSMGGSFNKAVVANESKGIIQIFDVHTDSPPLELFHGAQGVNMIEIADLNGDGLGDIIPVSYEGYTNVWFQNNQEQGFQKKRFTTSQSKVGAVTVADFDRDGDQDVLLASDHKKQISILINNGTGQFTDIILEEGVVGVLDMAVLDMNMDGAMDLAYVSHKEKNVQLLLNKDGEFERKKVSTKLRSLNNIRVFDLANDGRPDLVISSFGDNTIRIIENTTDGLREHVLRAQIPSPTDIAIKKDRDTGKTKLYVSSMVKSKLYAIEVTTAD